MSFDELLGHGRVPDGASPETTSAGPQPGTEGRQLALIRVDTDRDWELDATTRRVGRRGIAAVREVLSGAKPPEVYGELPAA